MTATRQLDQIISGIIDYLQATNQLDLLPQLAAKLTEQSRFTVDPNLAVVYSKQKLTSTQLKNLKKTLNQLFGRSLRLKNKLDNHIIACFRVEVAGQVIDATVNQKLKQVKNTIIFD